MDTKKVVVIVVLVVVIVIAGVLTMKHTSSTTSAVVEKSRQSAMAAKADKIDNKSFEVISETLADWNSKYAPDKEGHFKNPKTGEYTMVQVMKCAACGANIPYPDLPPELRQPKGKRRSGGLDSAIDEFLRDYKCPKCGKNAYISEGGGEK